MLFLSWAAERRGRASQLSPRARTSRGAQPMAHRKAAGGVEQEKNLPAAVVDDPAAALCDCQA